MPKFPKLEESSLMTKVKSVSSWDMVIGTPGIVLDQQEDAREIEEPESPTSSQGPGVRPRRMRSLNDIYEPTEEVDEAVEENVNLVCFHMNADLIAYADATQDRKWKIAMDEEINAIEKNDTWSLTTLPEGRKAIGVKWVYKTKKNANGEVQRYKVRLVAKEYKQKIGIYARHENREQLSLREHVEIINSITSQLRSGDEVVASPPYLSGVN
ncbi:hypothetical protein SASPL_148425 [Salvia splendens]|uniref:Reverse transcriptase Ty1/copia-type domain-containing protein n=1 Tax=Salvia splendens TaxID=180675 RepID=A0A8X8Z3P2_SALSN|nr:hypothetical protein SASPL_148425 [Salvia splendens]